MHIKNIVFLTLKLEKITKTHVENSINAKISWKRIYILFLNILCLSIDFFSKPDTYCTLNVLQAAKVKYHCDNNINHWSEAGNRLSSNLVIQQWKSNEPVPTFALKLQSVCLKILHSSIVGKGWNWECMDRGLIVSSQIKRIKGISEKTNVFPPFCHFAHITTDTNYIIFICVSAIREQSTFVIMPETNGPSSRRR